MTAISHEIKCLREIAELYFYRDAYQITLISSCFLVGVRANQVLHKVRPHLWHMLLECTSLCFARCASRVYLLLLLHSWRLANPKNINLLIKNEFCVNKYFNP